MGIYPRNNFVTIAYYPIESDKYSNKITWIFGTIPESEDLFQKDNLTIPKNH